MLSTAEFIALLNPKVVDALWPHSPFVLSEAFVELAVAGVGKQASTEIADRALVARGLSFLGGRLSRRRAR